jgi:integrase/recombinase XerD
MQADLYSKGTVKTSLPPGEQQVIALWLRQQPSENTRGAYTRDVGRLMQFVEKPLRQITALDLIEFTDDLLSTGLAPISRARTLTAVRSFLRFAHRAGVLTADLADSIQLPRCDNMLAQRIIAEDQVRKMIDLEANARNRAILALLYACGLRVSELCGLRTLSTMALRCIWCKPRLGTPRSRRPAATCM